MPLEETDPPSWAQAPPLPVDPSRSLYNLWDLSDPAEPQVWGVWIKTSVDENLTLGYSGIKTA